MTGDLDRWLAVGDLDELIREIERRCDRGDWAGVEEVRRRSRAAIERGHQLWPASSYAEYRLALDAPPQWAASVITDESGYMAPGPLTEVVAQGHTWTELAPYLPLSARRTAVAQERVVRGESVDDADCGDMPGRLSDWEPDYSLAVYRGDGTEFPAPELVEPTTSASCPPGAVEDPDAADGARALVEAVRHWSTRSGGVVRTCGVAGGPLDALGALGLHEVRIRACTPAEAGALLSWAAADGALHGPRRGVATARFELWWALAVLAGVQDDWPLDPGGDAARLEFALWLPTTAVTGWSCRLCVTDPDDGLSWALDAHEDAPATTGRQVW